MRSKWKCKLRDGYERESRALALSLNKPLIKKLKDALDRINSGNYVNEEEFFSKSTA